MSADYYADDEYEPSNWYAVAMRGCPNMATVQWANTEREAIAKTAREWGCKPEDCYVYKGHDE